jgi:dTDP-4-amino-4,6-dideoxygalactose transaminase
MGPHDNAALQLNYELLENAGDATVDIDWECYVGSGGACTLTLNGREAIALALADVQLSPGDEILILTTTGSAYISRCVTDTIAGFCGWSRQRSERTRAIFVIHEFGFPCAVPAALLGAGLPIIEDCAYALGSQNPQGTVGLIGDYTIYSFSKALPVAFGGLLRTRRGGVHASRLSAQASRGLPVLLAHHLPKLAESCLRRRRNFERYRALFAAAGLRPLLEPTPEVVPHSFVVAMDDQRQAEAMKPILYEAGIISSVFYGGGGYYLPNHQSMSDAAVEYVVAHFSEALQRS